MKPHVYIVRGAPASGKGTVMPEFARLLPKPVALIEQDKLRWGIHLIGRSAEEVTSEEHRMAYENTLFLYERYLKSGSYTIVVEGLFTWNDMDSDQGAALKFIELAHENGFEVTPIVLKADKQTLIHRNIQRHSHTTPDDEFNVIYNGVYGIIDDSELVIDSTHDTVNDTIDKLRRCI